MCLGQDRDFSVRPSGSFPTIAVCTIPFVHKKIYHQLCTRILKLFMVGMCVEQLLLHVSGCMFYYHSSQRGNTLRHQEKRGTKQRATVPHRLVFSHVFMISSRARL